MTSAPMQETYPVIRPTQQACIYCGGEVRPETAGIGLYHLVERCGQCHERQDTDPAHRDH